MFNAMLDLGGYLALMHQPVHLLSPRLLAAVARKGYLDALTGYHALPLILRQICLARGSGDSVDPTTVVPGASYARIGDEIPSMQLMTIDLEVLQVCAARA
ncbi:hypothetical protein BDV12DRAFT_200371 [Aspergillus spectabilis]